MKYLIVFACVIAATLAAPAPQFGGFGGSASNGEFTFLVFI